MTAEMIRSTVRYYDMTEDQLAIIKQVCLHPIIDGDGYVIPFDEIEEGNRRYYEEMCEAFGAEYFQ